MDIPKSTPAQSPVDFDREADFTITPRRPQHSPDTTGSALFRQVKRGVKAIGKTPGAKRSTVQIRKSWQRCTVRIKYTRITNTKHSWIRHAGYITMRSRTGVDPTVCGFDQTRGTMNVRETVREWHEAKDPRLFRIIISPENTQADLQKLTRAMMEAAEVQMGRKFEWAGVIHTNTPHPHVHLVLRGVANGRSLVLPRDMVCGGMRKLASDHLTRQLGYQFSAFDSTQGPARPRNALRELPQLSR